MTVFLRQLLFFSQNIYIYPAGTPGGGSGLISQQFAGVIKDDSEDQSERSAGPELLLLCWPVTVLLGQYNVTKKHGVVCDWSSSQLWQTGEGGSVWQNKQDVAKSGGHKGNHRLAS